MKKVVWVVLISILAVIFGIAVMRVISGEDDWICNGRGVWIKHGNPSSKMPTTPCKVDKNFNP